MLKCLLFINCSILLIVLTIFSATYSFGETFKSVIAVNLMAFLIGWHYHIYKVSNARHRNIY